MIFNIYIYIRNSLLGTFVENISINLLLETIGLKSNGYRSSIMMHSARNSGLNKWQSEMHNNFINNVENNKV